MANDATSQSGGKANIATGSFTSDGNAVDIELGFNPRYIKVFDMDAVTTHEFCEGMPDTETIKTVTGGSMTVETGSIIVPDVNGFTIAAAEMTDTNVVVWVAMD